MKEISPKIYQCEIPLPENPLKSLNCYVIKGKERNLVIDTGFNRKECRDAFFTYMDDLNIDLRRTDIVITHLHSDHSGLASELYQKGARLYFSQGDGDMTKIESSNQKWEGPYALMKLFGFEESDDFFDRHPGKAYGSTDSFEFTPLQEDDQVGIDEYQFRVVSVPGHTPDIINLYDEKKKIYFSGDHVLNVITPNIAFWGFHHPVILEQYFKSLRKTYDFDIELMLPSHRSLIKDHRKRIDELLEHHRHRLDEVVRVLQETNRELTVQEIAARMQWRIKAKDWDDFPDAQKWFASSEAMAHLDYLVHYRKVTMKKRDGIMYFSADETVNLPSEALI